MSEKDDDGEHGTHGSESFPSAKPTVKRKSSFGQWKRVRFSRAACAGRAELGGEREIRTPGGVLTHSRFPGVRFKPLSHLSAWRAKCAEPEPFLQRFFVCKAVLTSPALAVISSKFMWVSDSPEGVNTARANLVYKPD